ncbi:MAG: hypothetical protein NW208_16085 [Bryobacter sp.]|nr:hypothetical protein [Bryobacter sp.]
MNPALLSLGALLLAILLSCFTQRNIGLLAIALAGVVGSAANLDANAIMAGFPVSLFLTIAGITLLFTQAELNGTLLALTSTLMRVAQGNGARVLLLLSLLAALLSAFGAGAIAATALVTPVAMRTAQTARLPLFLMAILIGLGANAGNLAPLSPVGVVVNTLLAQQSIAVEGGQVFWVNALAHLLLIALAFCLFGGLAQFRRQVAMSAFPPPEWTRPRIFTLALLLLLLASVMLYKIPLGLAAFGLAALLVLLHAAPEAKAIAAMPWSVIVMVCGVTMLIAIIEKSGGMDIFSGWIARFSTANSIHATLAFLTALISTYASTSGVVLPAFVPTLPRLATEAGVEISGLVSSIVLGSHLVDVSPLSTIGAMAVATVDDEPTRQRLFRQLLLWSFSMCPVAALISYVWFRHL